MFYVFNIRSYFIARASPEKGNQPLDQLDLVVVYDFFIYNQVNSNY